MRDLQFAILIVAFALGVFAEVTILKVSALEVRVDELQQRGCR